MKKLFLLLATLSILLMSLTGCGGDKTDDMVSDVESGMSSIVSNTESMLDNDNGNVSSHANN